MGVFVRVILCIHISVAFFGVPASLGATMQVDIRTALLAGSRQSDQLSSRFQ